MSTSETVQRVCIYIDEHDQWDGQPLYRATLELLRRGGATGATVLRGLAGFGPGQRSYPTNLTTSHERIPIVIEWIDLPERITQILPLLDDMLANALITLEEVQIHRATLRRRGPLAIDRSVGDIMNTEPHAVAETTSLGEALGILFLHNQHILPIIDQHQRVLGVITEAELTRRAGLQLPLRLLRLLDTAELTTILTPLLNRPVVDIMNRETRVVYVSATIPQALTTMLEWNYQQIAVINREGMLAGLLNQNDILHAVVTMATERDARVRDAEPPTATHLIMQTVVPHVTLPLSLAAVLERLLTTPDGYLIVVDETKQIQGSLSDSQVLHYFQGKDRAAWLTALQHNASLSPENLPGANHRLDDILERNLLTVSPTDTVIDVTRRILEYNVERVPVVDANGHLLGMLARGGLLRALAQESE